MHPRRALAFMLVVGLVIGGAIGYLRFDRSVLWAAALGVSVAAVLTYATRKHLRDPTAGKRATREQAIPALASLALHFLVILVAFLVGLATGSLAAFTVVFAIGFVLVFVLRVVLRR